MAIGLSLLAQQPQYGPQYPQPSYPPGYQQPSYQQPPYTPGYQPPQYPIQPPQQYGQQPQYPQTSQQQDPPDQPGQPVARVGVMDGDVSVRRGDSGDWVAAILNAPLMAGDSISVPAGGRAEMQLDNGNYARIGGDTEVRISDLDPGRIQIQLAKGLVTYRVLRDTNDQAEISTPAVAVHPLRASAVRVEIAPDGMTRITVRHGDVEASTPKGTQHVHEGNMMLVRGTPDEPEFQIVAATRPDAWDGFNDQRDAYLLRAQSNRYLNPDVNGGEDLDAYGAWGNDPQYGPVWTPNVAPGWTPYSDGQWVWEDFYGWTWVDYAPWGWAPFHYGSWYMRAGFGWTWFPGPRIGHYWWHPAMVGFFGFGGGVGVGFGFGNIGWVALAPFELFHPWYGPRGFGGGVGVGVNLVRNANIAGLYRNARAGGVTAVSGADFQRGQFRNHVAVSGAQLQQASLVRGAVPVTPTASNLRFSNRAASTAGPRGEMSSQRFFSRTGTRGAAAPRTPFAQQQASMRSAVSGSERAGGQEQRRPGGGAQGGRCGSRGRCARGGSAWQRFSLAAVRVTESGWGTSECQPGFEWMGPVRKSAGRDATAPGRTSRGAIVSRAVPRLCRAVAFRASGSADRAAEAIGPQLPERPGAQLSQRSSTAGRWWKCWRGRTRRKRRTQRSSVNERREESRRGTLRAYATTELVSCFSSLFTIEWTCGFQPRHRFQLRRTRLKAACPDQTSRAG